MQIGKDLLQGIVVETTVPSYLGGWFYSDLKYNSHNQPAPYYKQPALNQYAAMDVIGIAAGIVRMTLAIFHTIGHLFAALVTFKKGHTWHAAKGACEFLRGFIEAIPFLGRKFAKFYFFEGKWWIIKIYNPEHPDSLDKSADNWSTLKENRPTAYFVS